MPNNKPSFFENKKGKVTNAWAGINTGGYYLFNFCAVLSGVQLHQQLPNVYCGLNHIKPHFAQHLLRTFDG